MLRRKKRSKHSYSPLSALKGDVTSYFKSEIQSAKEAIVSLNGSKTNAREQIIAANLKCDNWLKKIDEIRDLEVRLIIV